MGRKNRNSAQKQKSGVKKQKNTGGRLRRATLGGGGTTQKDGRSLGNPSVFGDGGARVMTRNTSAHLCLLLSPGMAPPPESTTSGGYIPGAAVGTMEGPSSRPAIAQGGSFRVHLGPSLLPGAPRVTRGALEPSFALRVHQTALPGALEPSFALRVHQTALPRCTGTGFCTSGSSGRRDGMKGRCGPKGRESGNESVK